MFAIRFLDVGDLTVKRWSSDVDIGDLTPVNPVKDVGEYFKTLANWTLAKRPVTPSSNAKSSHFSAR